MWRQIYKEWSSLSHVGKTAVIAMLLALAPLLVMVINRLGANFDTIVNPYQHMDMIYHLVHGKLLYAPLSTEYNCVTYTPLYWYLSAIPCKLFGMSFFWPRLVSLLASLGCAVLLFLWSWRLTERNLPLSVAAPVIFLSTSLSYFWVIDINVGATLFFFTFLGFYLLINPTLRNTILAAVALSAAVLTKQTALAYVVAAGTMLFFVERKRTLVFVGIALAILATSFWYLETYEGDFYRQIIQSNTSEPYMWKRIFTEVLPFYLGTSAFVLVFAFIHLLVDDQFDRRSFWRRIWKIEYVIAVAGIGVGIIASPKLGSGPTSHAIIGVGGLALCGMAGLYQTAKLIKPSCSERICVGVALAQIAAIMLLAVPTYPSCLIDRYDRKKNANIANVFNSGRTCLFGCPYIQRQYGQPSAGVPDDSPTKFKNGQLTYEFIPEELSLPFKKQEFDYVIVGSYFDPAHPVVKAIMENYKTMLGRFPAHPKYPREGGMRFDCYVLKANRLQSAPQTNSQTNRFN